jgi:hypothetical protein
MVERLPNYEATMEYIDEILRGPDVEDLPEGCDSITVEPGDLERDEGMWP